MSPITCRPRSLSVSKLTDLARRTVTVNPANSLDSRTIVRTPVGRIGGPRRLVLIKGNRWRTDGVRLSVQFMDSFPVELRKRILLHMNAWDKTCNVVFRETRGTGQVRIARESSPPDMAGYWSYIGTEILQAEEDEPTMNLQGFTLNTAEPELRRVVRHETGHTLGFDHEHMRSELVKRIDKQKAYRYYDLECGWPKHVVDEQVLTPLRKRSIMGTTESDPKSIMCYEIPAEITKDGKAILGGSDISRRDYAFAGSIYPKKLKK